MRKLLSRCRAFEIAVMPRLAVPDETLDAYLKVYAPPSPVALAIMLSGVSR